MEFFSEDFFVFIQTLKIFFPCSKTLWYAWRVDSRQCVCFYSSAADGRQNLRALLSSGAPLTPIRRAGLFHSSAAHPGCPPIGVRFKISQIRLQGSDEISAAAF